VLASGQSLAIFPEGTTGAAVTLLPFQPSLFVSLFPPPLGLRVQPVALDYTDAQAIAWSGDEPAGANALRILGMPGRRVLKVRFLAPLDPASYRDRKAIAAAARTAIADALRQPL
jgi:1-acyl-sn-glycerol-3-phosphate acyltransferase